MVLGKRTVEQDGYSALILGFEEKREKLVNKPEQGFFEKAGAAREEGRARVPPARGRASRSYEVGQVLKPSEVFAEGQLVDVVGTSKGRGFTGVMKRRNFAGAAEPDARHPRVQASRRLDRHQHDARPHAAERKMPGQLRRRARDHPQPEGRPGDGRRAARCSIEGAVPGPRNGYVTVRGAIKEARRQGRGRELSARPWRARDDGDDTRTATGGGPSVKATPPAPFTSWRRLTRRSGSCAAARACSTWAPTPARGRRTRPSGCSSEGKVLGMDLTKFRGALPPHAEMRQADVVRPRPGRARGRRVVRRGDERHGPRHERAPLHRPGAQLRALHARARRRQRRCSRRAARSWPRSSRAATFPRPEGRAGALREGAHRQAPGHPRREQRGVRLRSRLPGRARARAGDLKVRSSPVALRCHPRCAARLDMERRAGLGSCAIFRSREVVPR